MRGPGSGTSEDVVSTGPIEVSPGEKKLTYLSPSSPIPTSPGSCSPFIPYACSGPTEYAMPLESEFPCPAMLLVVALYRMKDRNAERDIEIAIHGPICIDWIDGHACSDAIDGVAEGSAVIDRCRTRGKIDAECCESSAGEYNRIRKDSGRGRSDSRINEAVH